MEKDQEAGRRTQRNQQARGEKQEGRQRGRAKREEQEDHGLFANRPLTDQEEKDLLEFVQGRQAFTDERKRALEEDIREGKITIQQRRDLLIFFQADEIARLTQSQEALVKAITQLAQNQEALEEVISAQGEPQNHTVSLDADAYVTAETLANKKSTSIPQLLRKAVTTQRWFDDVQAAGGRILVEEGGKLREVRDITEKQPQQPEAK